MTLRKIQVLLASYTDRFLSLMNSNTLFRGRQVRRRVHSSMLLLLSRVTSSRMLSKQLFAVVASTVVAICSLPVKAELIPADRLTDWTPGVKVGVPGGIPTNRTRLIDVTKAPYNADKTGAADCGGAFAAALAASSDGDVIYFPPGRFASTEASGREFDKHNRTIRGAGMDVTFIDSRVGFGSAINIGTGSSFNYPGTGNTVTAGLSKGSTVLTIGDTSVFDVGQLIQIEFENQTDDTLIAAGTTPVLSVSGMQYMRRQMTRITGKSGNKLTIFPGIYHTPAPDFRRELLYQPFIPSVLA